MVAAEDLLLTKDEMKQKYEGKGSPDYPTHHGECGCSGCYASWTEWRGAHAAAEVMKRVIVKFGRAYVARKAESAFSTAHLANFLDAVDRGEHLKSST